MHILQQFFSLTRLEIHTCHFKDLFSQVPDVCEVESKPHETSTSCSQKRSAPPLQFSLFP